MWSSTERARALIAWIDDLRDATDLLAARLRTPLHRLTLTMITIQGAVAGAKAAGAFDVLFATHARVAHLYDAIGVWVGLGSTVIAFYTQRKGEAAALIQSRRRDTASIAVASAQPTSERNEP